jgi:hypothetical protein
VCWWWRTPPTAHSNRFQLFHSSSRPFQFLSEDLFGHPILLHSLQVAQPTYPLPFIHFTIFSPLIKSSSSQFVPLFHSPSSYLINRVVCRRPIRYLPSSMEDCHLTTYLLLCLNPDRLVTKITGHGTKVVSVNNSI